MLLMHSVSSWTTSRLHSVISCICLCCTFVLLVSVCYLFGEIKLYIIGPIPWGHSGPLCHALSVSSSSLSLWTSHAACAIAIADVRLATPGD